MSKGGTADRTEIVNQIRKVYLPPNQRLLDFSLPDSVYHLARNLVEKGGKNRSHYYTVLNCMEDGDIYDLLEQAAGQSTLENASGVVGLWRVALNALLHYALNLLLAPKRPELRKVKVSIAYLNF